MRSFFINSEIFLNSGEEILFDREMGQFNDTCICCSEAGLQDLAVSIYLLIH